MVGEEKAESAGKLAWIEAEPAVQDAPISVWWDQPPAGGDDDGYARLKAAVGNATTRKP
jgi:hypothetical protein